MGEAHEPDGAVRIAMWSGPRNLSTALMRAFGARDDCAVWDEPFYAAYLAATGIDHPMREEVLAAHESDPASVAARCAGPAPGGAAIFYQKHMTHHMLEGFDLSFLGAVRSAFLVRAPERVVASYEARREEPTLADIGVERQAELFERVAERLGRAPPVVDAERLAAAPRATLEALCAALAIPFDPAMLSWAPGARPEDGVWFLDGKGSGLAVPGNVEVVLKEQAVKVVARFEAEKPDGVLLDVGGMSAGFALYLIVLQVTEFSFVLVTAAFLAAIVILSPTPAARRWPALVACVAVPVALHLFLARLLGFQLP